MEYIPKEQIHRNIITSPKRILVGDVEFQKYFSSESMFRYVYTSFYSGSALEYIPEQNLDEFDVTGSFVYYQVPLNKRGYDIKRNTFSITVNNNYYIDDDGFGNLYERGTTKFVGNVFYNIGIVNILNTGSFENSSINFQDLDVSIYEKNITFVRDMKFIEERIHVSIDSDAYTYSTNPTFQFTGFRDAPFPYLTKIILYNDDNEIIAVASLSRPVELSTDVFLVLDMLETI
jgi:hypothetical protein